MDRKELHTKQYFILAVAALYLIGILKGDQLWGNIGSPATAFAAGYLIWSGLRRIENFRLNWILLLWFTVFWGFTDTLWFICSDFLGLDPENMPVFEYLYTVPNILLTIATIMYFYKNMRRWHTAQVVLDSAATLVILCVFSWQIIVKDYNFSLISYEDILSIFLYLLTDIIVMSIIAVMYLQRGPLKLGTPLRLLISGIIVYTGSDMYYTYLLFKDAYDANTLIDFIYMSGIVLFALACIYEAYNPVAPREYDLPDIPERPSRVYQYALMGAVSVLFYFTGYITGVIIWQILLILAAYMLLTSFIQENVRNEYLLKKEKHLNEKLEDTILERTRDLLEANSKLELLTKTDILTGLYNRRYMLEAMDKFISGECSSFSIFYMDLDRFKTINDTHGHDMGDKILVAIAERLNGWRSSKEQPENIVISRLGGDEFFVILEEDNSLGRLEKLCLELTRLINEPLIIKQYIFNLGVSIGVSRYPDDSQDREQLVRYADMAMYQAKKGYGNLRYIIFDKGKGQQLQMSNELEMLLKNAEYEKEFELHYQPQFSIKNGRLIGVEALLRWNSPEKGYIPPMEFIPIAEETGLILEIGNWVMKKAIQQICYWNRTYQMELIVGVNISARQIDSVDFLPDFKKMLEIGGLNPKWLDLEITETSAMNTHVIMEEILTELSTMGFSISIDDFGTGYSSLSYIKRFDIDRLKIAKELIDNISFDKDDLHIVKAIIMMARGLGLKTIAEGVETNDQLNILRMLGCDEVQGYLLSRPLPAKVFEENFLENEAAVALN